MNQKNWEIDKNNERILLKLRRGWGANVRVEEDGPFIIKDFSVTISIF